MRISFLCNYVVGGWKPTDKRLGGTEESIVEWSRELTKRGHKVDIYDNDTRGSYAGGYDICINIKSYDKPPLEPTLYLTNETDASKHDLSKYAGVIWPSQWAVDNIPVNNRTFILPHGYDPVDIFPGNKVRYQCFYSSSPDRGLDTLLEIWPTIHDKHPKATLVLTYGATVPPMDGVINLGAVDKGTMSSIYVISDFWLHPCNGGELYGMTGVKAQAAGCIPVIIPRMALSETVINGYWADDESSYIEALDKALSATDKEILKLREELAGHHFPDWKDSANKLEEIIASVLK